MSKYVLNEDTTLILDGEVYVLAREKEVTSNNVCEKCSLNDICFDIHGSSNFYRLCTPEDGDGRWFFKRQLMFGNKGGFDFVRLINKCFQHK